jgi:hypothetical protein
VLLFPNVSKRSSDNDGWCFLEGYVLGFTFRRFIMVGLEHMQEQAYTGWYFGCIYVDPHASRAFAAVKLSIEVEARGYFSLRHPSEDLIYGAQNEGSKKMAWLSSGRRLRP